MKEFYTEDPQVTMMAEEEADRIRHDNNKISVVDLADGDHKRPTPNPCIKFEHAFQHYR